MSATTLWYLSRGTGIVALLLLTASVLLGVLTVHRYASPGLPRFVTAGLHRNIALLVLLLLAAHIATAVADSYAPIHWLDAVVPLASAYRPVWLGLGALSFDLLLAVVGTSLLRHRLGARTWRAVHWLTYAAWPVAVLHGLGTGTDTKVSWVLLVTAGCVLAVVAAVVTRLVLAAGAPTGLRLAGGALAVLLPVVATVWVVTGPLAPGWARRSGTPAALLAGSATTAGSASAGGSSQAAPAGTGLPAPPFDSAVHGTISQGGEGRPQVGLSLVLDRSGTSLDVLLTGAVGAGGGAQLTGGQVQVGNGWGGPVTGVAGNTITASLTDSSGRTIPLTLSLTLSGTSVTGTAGFGRPR